ncbi:MAG: tRNA (adenosine(37)-N6)-threonylcarbamoyltransferase complex ATPase subunit type 1 TsaE [Patescibacteria group bacterium]
MEVTLLSLADFAAEFVAALPKAEGQRAHLVGLRGDLGAGKTTFVQEVAKLLGADTPTSPTFVFAQRYATTHPIFRSLIHIDGYRLQSGEAHTIGFTEFLKDPKNLMLVEWPERLGADFPPEAPILDFVVTGEDTRSITYAK